jgi:hypothetical protein
MKTQLLIISAFSILAACTTQSTSNSAAIPPNKDGSIAIRFGGGDGSSIKNAITLIGANSEIAGIGGETLWAQQYLSGWQKTNQELIANGRKSYDAITYRSPDGKTRTVYFDISNFFGKLF